MEVDEQSGDFICLLNETDEEMMASSPSFCAGPLDALRRCVHEGSKVRVLIQGVDGMRGTCTGFVVAFDKLWNLVMTDVDEVFQKKKGREPALGEAQRIYTGQGFYRKQGVYRKPNEIVETILLPRSGGTTKKLKPAPRHMKRTFTGLGPAMYGISSSQSMNAVGKFDDKEEGAYLGQGAKDDSFLIEKGKTDDGCASTVTKQVFKKKDWSQWVSIKCFKRHIGKVFIRGCNVVLINTLY